MLLDSLLDKPVQSCTARINTKAGFISTSCNRRLHARKTNGTLELGVGFSSNPEAQLSFRLDREAPTDQGTDYSFLRERYESCGSIDTCTTSQLFEDLISDLSGMDLTNPDGYLRFVSTSFLNPSLIEDVEFSVFIEDDLAIVLWTGANTFSTNFAWDQIEFFHLNFNGVPN